ncbi:hypothetical protein F66182_10561 [Fusarium sp. NRRL 66182]|nr:hypothetical protein F66182_10561 [Fusarium sp. NRRL 66182]
MALRSSNSSVTASTKSWDSDTDSNPIFRDPTHRLRRYKSTVTSAMFSLYNQGPEGKAVLQKDELSFRGWQNPVMQDGTSTPDDIGFWKAKEQHLTREWRRIESKRQQTEAPKSRMIGLAADRIYAWITVPAEQVAHSQTPDRDTASVSCAPSPSQAVEHSQELRRRTMQQDTRSRDLHHLQVDCYDRMLIAQGARSLLCTRNAKSAGAGD